MFDCFGLARASAPLWMRAGSRDGLTDESEKVNAARPTTGLDDGSAGGDRLNGPLGTEADLRHDGQASPRTR